MDEHLFSNIGFVTDSIDATKHLVGSIEHDLRDIRAMVQQRLQRRVDLEQLASLLQTENDILKNKIVLIEKENQAVRESAEEQMQALEDECEGRIMTVQAEMDRVLADSRVVKEDRDTILAKARELDTYCTGVENELSALKSSHETTLQRLRQTEAEKQQLELLASSFVQDQQRRQQEYAILQHKHDEMRHKLQQLEAWQQSIIMRQEHSLEGSPKVVQRLDQRVMQEYRASPTQSQPLQPLSDLHFEDERNPYRDTGALSSSSVQRFPLFTDDNHSDYDSPPVPSSASRQQPPQHEYSHQTQSPAVSIGEGNRQRIATDHSPNQSAPAPDMFDLRDPDEFYEGEVQLNDLLHFKI